MQPQLTALPSRPDAVLDYFTPLADQPWSMLLHSGHSDHPDSRYDILVAAPAVTLVTRDGVTEIGRGQTCECRDDDPFALVQQQLTASGMMASPDAELPFQGGALGYFGYDLARGIETLPVWAQQDLPLPDMAIGIYRWAVVADHLRRTLLVADRHIHCSVGGGLVADSDEEAEYQETLAKVASLLPLLERLHA